MANSIDVASNTALLAAVEALNRQNEILGGLAGGSSGSLPAGGTTGQVLTKISDKDGDAEWQEPADTAALPTGGSPGQVLVKSSAAAGDAKWVTLQGNGGAAYAYETLEVDTSKHGYCKYLVRCDGCQWLGLSIYPQDANGKSYSYLYADVISKPSDVTVTVRGTTQKYIEIDGGAEYTSYTVELFFNNSDVSVIVAEV